MTAPYSPGQTHHYEVQATHWGVGVVQVIKLSHPVQGAHGPYQLARQNPDLHRYRNLAELRQDLLAILAVVDAEIDRVDPS